MSNTIGQISDGTEFEEVVRLAFASYWDLSRLGQSPLAYTPLVEACLLEGDAEIYPDARGIALRATLDWALEKLQSKGTVRTRLSREVLVKRYIEGMSATQYADEMFVSYPTAQTRRRSAIKRVVKIFQHELKSLSEGGQRQQAMIALRYASCSEQEQLLLRSLAIFRSRQQVGVVRAVQLENMSGQMSVEPHLTRLRTVNLLIGDEVAMEVGVHGVHPQIRAYLLTVQAPDERRQWNEAASRFYEQQGNLIEAVYHLQQAREHIAAAALLIEHQHEIGNQLPIVPLRERLADFERATLSADIWAQVKILAGRTAELAEELDVAQREYEQALGADDETLKGEAYYRLARIYRQRDIEVALRHYETCQELLAEAKEPKSRQLLAEAYISQAWMLIEQRFDQSRGASNLRQAERIIEESEEHEEDEGHQWLCLRSDLHNTWATFYAHNKDLDQYLEHRWLAWRYAREAEDIVRSINTAHNLGVAYARHNRYDEARRYFEESEKLALEAGDQRATAMSRKGIGGCYVSGSADYKQAIPYYRKAYDYFHETDNQYWQAGTCYDLTEAHAELGNAIQAKQYLDEGIQICDALGNERLKSALQQLAQTYVELSDDLSHRQRQALGFIRREGLIKRSEYKELTKVADKTAYLDLKDLLKKGVCVKEGRGPATRYDLAPQHVR